jgi:type VI secretion system protein ImpL
MKALGAILGKGWLLGLIVLLLVGALIWFGGPYVAFGEARPFESLTGRLVGLLVLVVLWALYGQWRLWRKHQQGTKLAGAVAAQSENGDASKGPASSLQADGESKALRERFERAVVALRKSKRASSLYELPWYVIIGAPGSGKTTALQNSGLEFPLEKEFGRDPLKGVGGTRNCDWWITDQAILLDTAGRYTTQESSQSADRGGWFAFLDLLARYRKRRPINGVLVAVSVADLASLDEGARDAQAQAIRRRLVELRERLKISFPVYVLVTKADLLAGFAEYFDDLNAQTRAQVWGITFPLEASQRGEALQRFSAEYDLLAARLQEGLIDRLGAERDVGRRATIHAFPSQFAGFKGILGQFLAQTFRANELPEGVWLRGCYLTSGTQEGTPIDRLTSAMARRFGLGVRAFGAAKAKGKAYFIESLLKQVVFLEAGQAGVNRKLELRGAVARIAGYAAVGLLTLVGLIGLFTSYRVNRQFVSQVGTLAKQVLADEGQVKGADGTLETALPRLDALRLLLETARKGDEGRVWRMGWGLNMTHPLERSAEDAYRRDLNAVLGPWAGEHFQAQLRARAAEPDKLYEYLKAYLMLGEPKRIDSAQLSLIGRLEWPQVFPSDSSTAQRVTEHFDAWVSDPDRVVPIQIDATLVEQARTSLSQASLPVLMYSRLRLASAANSEGALNLEHALALGSTTLFVRRSGKPLGDPIPALYTKPAFEIFNKTGRLDLVKQFLEDNWVLGDKAPAITQTPRLASDVLALYEQDYIRNWDAVMADLALRPIRDANEAMTVLALLASPSSPLKNLLALVTEHTRLTGGPPAGGAATGPAVAASAAVGAAAARMDQLLGTPAGGAQPGATVTAHFEPLHKLVDGPPGGAPIDRTLSDLNQLQLQLRTASGGAGGAATVAQVLDMVKVVAAQLPAPIASVIGEAGAKSGEFALGEARTELGNRYRTQVVAECRDLVDNRYPLNRSSSVDVAVADFGRVFATGGVFDAFFQSQLQQFVDTSRATWRWKEETKTIAAVPLRPFQDAQRIGQAFFAAGGQVPTLQFTLTPESLDADINRFVLTIDGQTLEYSHGPQRPLAVNWPAPVATGVSFVFEEKSGGRSNRSFQGPWAVFRMIDSATVEKRSETQFLVTVSAGGHSAKLVLNAASVRNPFARPELLRFRCGA